MKKVFLSIAKQKPTTTKGGRLGHKVAGATLQPFCRALISCCFLVTEDQIMARHVTKITQPSTTRKTRNQFTNIAWAEILTKKGIRTRSVRPSSTVIFTIKMAKDPKLRMNESSIQEPPKSYEKGDLSIIHYSILLSS